MKHSVVAPARTTLPVVAAEVTKAPAVEASAAANDDVHIDRQRAREDESLGPLWVITIGMGVFFGVAALVIAFG